MAVVTSYCEPPLLKGALLLQTVGVQALAVILVYAFLSLSIHARRGIRQVDR